MIHRLIFFLLGHTDAAQLPELPAAARVFIRSRGEKLGEMEFPPGESTLFFLAAEELTEQMLMPLLTGPQDNLNDAAEEAIGEISAEAAVETVQILSQFLTERPETSVGIAALSDRYDIPAERIYLGLKELRGLLHKAAASGGQLVTLYR